MSRPSYAQGQSRGDRDEPRRKRRHSCPAAQGSRCACTVGLAPLAGSLLPERAPRAADRWEGPTAVKLTLDASEPLKDAMRVVGAVYGVKLVLAREVPQPGAPVDGTEPDTQGQPSQGGDPVAARKPRRNRRTATGDKTRPSKPASSARSGFP